MSMGLRVFAAGAGADEAAARAVMQACSRPGDHADGELDDRIVAFYEELRAAYPDRGSMYEDIDNCPWASMPLGTGIDHVFMNILWSAGDRVLEVIYQLAMENGLVVYDPQDDTVYLPPA
jgi:hypothetical protein